MFESWSQVMGGILATAGIVGFLSNLDEFYSTSDGEGAEVRGFLARWWDKHRDDELTAAQLFTLATMSDTALDIDAKTEHGRKIRFGKLLSDLRDRRYRVGDLLVTVTQAGKLHQATLWKLQAWEYGSVGEFVSSAHTRAREEFIGGGNTPTDSHTPTEEPEWVREDLFEGEDR